MECKTNEKKDDESAGLPDVLDVLSQTDWNEVWRMQMERRMASAARECADIWAEAESARRYWRTVAESNIEYHAHSVESIPVTKDSCVLDIGAGPGNMAVPLAIRSKWVTAVEPATGMADVLEEKAREYGLSNITCVRKKWEHIDISCDLKGHYDVIIASFSLGMMDIKAAIDKMNRVSCGSVHLFWFAGASDWEKRYRSLWPLLHGRPYHPGPKADVLFNVLYSMGIYPNITVFPYRSELCFASKEEAADEMGRRTGVSDPLQSKPLMDFLESWLKREDGRYTLAYSATCVAMRWTNQKPFDLSDMP